MKLASGSSILFVVSFVLLFMKFPEIHGAALNKRDYYLSIEQDATPPAPPPTPPTPPPNAPSAPTPPSIPTSLPPVSIPTTVPNVINTFITTVTVTQTVPGGGGGGGEAPLATPSPIPSLTFPNDTSNATAWSLLSSNPDFKNFTTLLNTTAPDLVELLNSTESNVTVFSPPDSVFQPFLEQAFLRNFSSMNVSMPFYHALLSYHILNDTVLYSSSIPSNDTLTEKTMLTPFNVTLSQQAPSNNQTTTSGCSVGGGPSYSILQNEPITPPPTNTTTPTTPINGTFYVNNATFITPFDVNVTNGVIHPINKILTPLFYLNLTHLLPGPFNLLQ